MPCIDPIDPNFERAAEVTDMLCALLRVVEDIDIKEGRDVIGTIRGLRKWWEIHKAQDALDRARRA
jgi:hypothetical protein